MTALLIFGFDDDENRTRNIPQENRCIRPFLSSSLKEKVFDNPDDGNGRALPVSVSSEAIFNDPSLRCHTNV